MKTSIHYIRRVLDRLERMGWEQWKLQHAYETLSRRRQKELAA